MAHKYFVLLEKTPSQLWTPEFGDYDRETVEQEIVDLKESGSFVKGTKFKIVATNGKQSDLKDKVEQLNAITK